MPPSLQTRRLLLALGALGLLLACSGCAVLVPGNFALGRGLLLAASLILTPLFIYIISMRGGARRAARRRAIARKAELDAQLTAMVTPEAIRATADYSDPAADPPAAGLPTADDVKRET